jgi:NAD-dependent dihydropyrimidine dehydrogenase PreA subunit
MKRKIIKIDEEKCNGCGKCVPDCPEGALQIIDGKARLVGELLCDGLGACIGNCPEGAITIEEREAEEYDERKAMKNIVAKGPAMIKAHLKHLKDHSQDEYLKIAKDFLQEKKITVPELEDAGHTGPHGGACPGSMMMSFGGTTSPAHQTAGPAPSSELRQWPVQLQLLNPSAPYFKNVDLVIAADCVPFAYADFHRRFLKDKVLIIFCPKLDTTLEEYVEKLTAIFKNNDIKSVTILHMEVPCCFGTVSLVEEALKKSGKNILVKDYTISLRGEII